MVPLRRGTIPVPTSPKTVPHFTHLGHDFHERLVAFCHDGRGDCAVPALRNQWRCAFQWPVLNLRVT